MLKADMDAVVEIARTIAKEEIALALKATKAAKPVEKEKEPEDTGSAKTQFKKQ